MCFVICVRIASWKIQPRSGNCAGKYKVRSCDSVLTQVWSTVTSEAQQVTFCTGIPTDSKSSTSPWKMKSPLSCRRTNQLYWLWQTVRRASNSIAIRIGATVQLNSSTLVQAEVSFRNIEWTIQEETFTYFQVLNCKRYINLKLFQSIILIKK